MKPHKNNDGEIHCHAVKRKSVENEMDEGDWFVVLDGLKKRQAKDVWHLFQQKYGSDKMIVDDSITEIGGSLAFRMPENFTQEMTLALADRFYEVVNPHDDAESGQRSRMLKSA